MGPELYQRLTHLLFCGPFDPRFITLCA